MRLTLKRSVCGLALLTGLMAVSAPAQDFPTLKGDNARVGRNADPLNNHPGRAFLRWWRPNLLDGANSVVVVDNLQLASITAVGTWLQPVSAAAEAFNPYIPDPDLDAVTNPSYRFATMTASQANPYDPTQAETPAQLRTWTWNMDPASGVSRHYALYVWLPIGPTRNSAAGSFPARYQTYEIEYGNGQTWVDVVDTRIAGQGWVRLGNGGRETTRMFLYNGITPIRIRLHNTIARNQFGILQDAPANVVYADAALAVADQGYIHATPIVSEFDTTTFPVTHTVAALNRYEPIIRNNQPETIVRGVVTSYEFNSASGANNTRWTWTPADTSPALNYFQDNQASGVVRGAGWNTLTTPPGFRGTDFFAATITNSLAAATQVRYTPTLADGDYEIFVWHQGDSGATQFGRAVQYIVEEGANSTVVTLDQSLPAGWVRLGTRRFIQDEEGGEPLRVVVTNYSADPGDAGRLAYADSIRFVGGDNTAINSTPVHVRARVRLTPGAPVETPVVIVASEDGRIYCLDANGLGNGSTRVLWSYPSSPDPDDPSWTDPNHVSGEDGPDGIAEMPVGFDLSSALVQRINGEDYLFIGSTNGRVYCIRMDGRGDADFTRGVPGTTTRVWTWPDDYPSTRRPSNLGAIRGSVVYTETSDGPTLLVPTRQGRLFALDAEGTTNKRTTVRWAYPSVDQPNLGPIVMTPVVEFGRVYFGTQVKPGEDRGRFFALDVDTGAVDWQFNASTLWGTTALSQRADDFIGGPVTIPASLMSGMPDLVVVSNENRWITALDANTGAVQWTTDELGSGVVGNLMFTPLAVFDALGALQVLPTVVVPTTDGRLAALFAETSRQTVFGNGQRIAWGFDTASRGFVASTSVGRQWMYAADLAGNVLAFGRSNSVISPGDPPGQDVITPNDPASIPFREARVVFITRQLYERLRLPQGAAQHPTYAVADSASNHLPDGQAFEWGETMYAMVYRMPHRADNNAALQAVQAEFRFSTEGVSIRNLTVRGRQFTSPGSAPTGTTGVQLDGYVLVSFTLQGAGQTALPPGLGQLNVSLSAQLSPGSRFQSIILDPALTRRTFRVLNPIGLATAFSGGNFANPLANFQIGWTTNRGSEGAQVNGSPDVPSTGANESLLLSSVGLTSHGQVGARSFALVDRSLMTLLRGEGRGLDQVRIERRELAWQGGAAAVRNPLNPLAYPQFEDLPTNFPNDSLDYPNLPRERVALTKDLFGQTENPIFNPIALEPPTGALVNPDTRVLRPTPITVNVAVPRFQPANLVTQTNSDGGSEPGGYYGLFNVYVDSSGNGTLDRVGRREAFRSVWIGAGVPEDRRLSIQTPTVDLGALPHGLGYTASGTPYPWQPGSPFSPWAGDFVDYFRPFTVLNEGNVNLTNVRLAKSTVIGDAPPQPWGLLSPANHERSWLDTQLNLWSDIDARNALNNLAGNNQVMVQKSRVGDVSANQLLTNPVRRDNPLLGATQSPLLPGVPSRPPRVAVSVPIGTPVGTYVTQLRVIEELRANEALDLGALPGGNTQPIEPFSDPTMTLRFTVRESRLTNRATPGRSMEGQASLRGADPMITATSSGSEAFLHQNLQPAAMRARNGNLVVAYTSNSPTFNEPQPAGVSLNDAWRIYFATLRGVVPNSTPLGPSFLSDLMGAQPSGSRWFNQQVGPFPSQPLDLTFGLGASETIVPGTARFGSPVLPTFGNTNPFNGAELARTFVTFVGETQVQTPSGRRPDSRLFGSAVSVAADGSLTVTTERPLMSLDGGIRGRPALVVNGLDTGTVVVATGSGMNTLLWSSFLYETGSAGFTTTTPRSLEIGQGFEQVSSPSLFARNYRGVAAPGLASGSPIFELSFAGKLRGRPSAEIFYGRLLGGGTYGGPRNVPGLRSPLLALPIQVQERLAADGPNTFRVRGVHWIANGESDFSLQIRLGSGVFQPLVVPGSARLDRSTGLISAQTQLGGLVYLDPALGTVRFSGSAPARNADLRLTYTPRLLRVSGGQGAGYDSPSVIFDDRLIGEFGYWARPNNTSLVPPGATSFPNDAVRNARYIFSFGRTAAGAGQTARPYMRTMRLGVQLPTPVATDETGALVGLTVTNATAPFQVDPANGRVYFNAEDENRVISVTYNGVDETNGQVLPPVTVELPVQLVVERVEQPIAIDQAVNESQPILFPDPFDFAEGSLRRPGLLWMFWTSTRAGTPDLFFQTLAPRFTPSPVNRN